MKKNIAILLAVMALGVGPALGAEGKGDKVGQADETGMNVGALLGLQLDAGNDLLFGGTATYKMNPFWGAGLYATYSGSTTTFGTVTTKSSSVVLAPELSYFFDESMAGLRLGGKVGLLLSSGETTGQPSSNSTDLIFGPHIGYDYPLGGGLSLGGEFNLLFTTVAGSDSNPNALAALKYWF